MGFTVNVAQTAIDVWNDDNEILMFKGLGTAVVNGHEIGISDEPKIVQDTVMVPLRFLMENMGYEVLWQGGPLNKVELVPVAEKNSVIIGTVRERFKVDAFSVDVQYPKLLGIDPGVSSSLNNLFKNRLEPVFEQGFESAKANREFNELETGHTLYTQVISNYRLAYNQKNLASFVLDDYLYTGGAHGMTVRQGVTADLSTGKVYTLKDIFKTEVLYTDIIDREIKKQIEEMDLTLLNPFEGIRGDHDFYVEGGNLVVFFQQYELMPYAYGFTEFRIPLADLSGALIPNLF